MSMQDLTRRPVLAIVGHILDGDDPEMRTLELAQRKFSREANRRDVEEESVIAALVWLAGTRLQMHNVKGTLHTLGHLRARSRGRHPVYETLAGFLEVRLQLALREYDKAKTALARMEIPEADERFMARAKALKLSCEGQIMSAQGELDEATPAFKAAIEALRVGPAQVEDIAITVEVCNAQGRLAFRDGQLDEAQKVYGEAQTLAGHIGFRLALARSLRGKGAIFDTLAKHEEAIELFKEARTTYQECESSVGVLRTCISLGRASYALGSYRKALLYFEEAKIQCGQGRYPNEEAEINARIGDIMLAEGRYEKAAEFYERDLQIVSLQGTERARAHALRNVGRIQRLLGNFMRAEACLQESFEGFRKLGDRRGLGRTLGQLVYACLEQEKARKARQAVDLLADVIKPLRSEQETAIHAMLEGLVCRHEGDSVKAKNLLERSLRIFSSEPGFYTVTCRLELAMALRHMGKDDLAIKQLKQTIKESRGLKIHDIEQKAMVQLKSLDNVEWGRLLHSSGRGATDGFVQAERLIVATAYLDIREMEPYFGEAPEQFQQLVNQILHTLESEVVGPEAIIGQIRGGMIQLLFGLEDSCDPPAALRMVEKFFEVVDRDHHELIKQDKLGVAAGLVVGDAVKGTFGSPERKAFDLYGLSIDKARFLACAASTGNILVDESTYRSVLDEESEAAVRAEVTWRGLPMEAFRIKPRVKEVFRGSLAAPIN
jgi:tetratricopeptide (TPR) repeat protein